MRYLKIFLSIYTTRLYKDLSLPLFNQLFQIVGSLCFFILHLYSLSFILQKFSFPGWTTDEAWVLIFTFEIFTYLAFFLFWRGFNETVKDINTGRFDAIISKPISSLFLTFLRGGGIHNFVCTILGFLVLSFALISNHISVSIFSVIMYPIFILASTWIFFCLAVCFISLNFKYGYLTATPGLMFQVQEVYKYPSTLYSVLTPILFIVPVTLSLLTTFPAAIILSKPLPIYFYFIYLFSIVLSSLLAFSLWRTGLKNYSSASS